jgi:hypothetical protein
MAALASTLAKMDIKEQRRLSCWLQRLVRRTCLRAGSQTGEERCDIAGEQLGLLGWGEVPAARHRGPTAHVV